MLLVLPQKKLVKEIGKEKIVIVKKELPIEISELFEKNIADKFKENLFAKSGISDKISKENIQKLENDWVKLIEEKYPKDEEIMVLATDYMYHQSDKILHEGAINENKRADGRKMDEIRKLYAKAGGISPILHGSGIFYRGATHVFSVLTLGGPQDAHLLDGMEVKGEKMFMHHYNFPPFSAGETGRMTGTNRREVGHGTLAEKALVPVIPTKDKFPYTIRLVSESMASNGSTSMASVCASTLALLDGGVPIKTPVAGIAIGLMLDTKDNTKYKILTDIQGPEDHHGDMDFKVAGTRNGVTAIQLDIKVGGIPIPILVEALEQAKKARFQILDIIEKEISVPRPDISPNAPKILITTIKTDQIGLLIGPGGKMIKSIKEKTGAEINVEDDGTVYVTGKEGSAEKAIIMVKELTHEFTMGEILNGEVVNVLDFGAFVRIGHNTEGLVHISEIASFRIDKPQEFLKEGDRVPIKIIKIENGKVGLSIKAVDPNFIKKK